tara:strand:+ start:432 stop:656 length:225 start_codon:yes stop_codon:yes gene_type:complete
MALSVQAIENLLDLVEIKLGAMEIYDAASIGGAEVLEEARRELSAQLVDRTAARRRFSVVALNGRSLQPARSAA